MVPAVILAAGRGHLDKSRPDMPKVLEDLGGQPILEHVVRTAIAASLDPIVVVVNHATGPLIKETLSARGFTGLRYATQDRRLGAAEAADSGLRQLIGAEAVHCPGHPEHFVLMFGDMPLYRPTTVRRLVECHITSGARLSMVTLAIKRGLPRELLTYGRILRDPQGHITRVVEVKNATSQDMRTSRSVNPSLYAGDIYWMVKHIHNLKVDFKDDLARERNEGERHFPLLVEEAYREAAHYWGWQPGGPAKLEKRYVTEVPLDDPCEALGVNTMEQLEAVRKVYARRTPLHFSRELALNK